MVSISFPLEMWKNRDAVANILNDNGFEPAPEPGLRTKWSDFFERYCEMMTTAVVIISQYRSKKSDHFVRSPGSGAGSNPLSFKMLATASRFFHISSGKLIETMIVLE